MNEPFDDEIDGEDEAEHNRTGIARFRARSADMLAGAAEFAPASDGDGSALLRERVSSTKSSPPLGSTPPPSRTDGLCTLGARGVEDLPAPLAARLFDRLGERLGSERTSVRMYEALLAKHDALGAPTTAPARAELEQMLREEFDHYRMLEETVAELGGDPTALTPAADLAATMRKGLLQVLLDPRTRFSQCLEAVLHAELVDNEAWRCLAALFEQVGAPASVDRCRRALATESAHLDKLRRWVACADVPGEA